MWFRLLGPVEVDATGRTFALRRRQERCLLAVLLLHPGRLITAERLEELLWEANPPDHARRLLYSHVARVRAMLAEAGADDHAVALDSRGPGYVMRVDPDRVDAHRFRALVASAGEATDPVRRDELLRDALALWRGPALHNAATGWVRDQLCTDLDALHLHAVEESMATRIALRRYGDVAAGLAGLVATYPDRERLAELQITALYRAGRTTEALDAYTRIREHLASAFGLDPGAELVRLHQEVLRGAPPAQHEVPRYLPRDIDDFTGRTDLLDRLAALVPGGPHAGSVVVTVDGMPGVGKTALAVHLAHRLSTRFPDGQLAIDLHGHSRYAPVETATALQLLLRQLGIPGDRIPDGTDARAGLWRSELAGRRVLLLLDNAGSSAQVAPLLPAVGGCLTLVTSRQRLAGLDGVRSHTLGVLDPHEAVELMRRVAGDRVAADPTTAGEVARRCGHLTLAVRLAAARLAHRPGWTVGDLATRLEDARTGLAEIAAEGRTVHAAFSLSYQQLRAGAQRLFRLLGLPTGADISTPAAASLAGLDLGTADGLLAELVDAHLLDEPAAGRYRLHDLLRQYAAELAEATDPQPDRRAAVGRLLDHYLHGAVAAARTIEPAKSSYDYGLGQPLGLAPPVHTGDSAHAWYVDEQRNLVAAAAQAADGGWHSVSWRLTRACWYYLYRNGFYDDWAAMHGTALRAARTAGDRAAEATLHNYQAGVLYRQSRWDESLADLDRAARIWRETGNHSGYVMSLTNRARICVRTGRYVRALPLLTESERLGVESGASPAVMGDVYANIGLVHLLTGRYDLAEGYFAKQLHIAESIGTDIDRGAAYSHLGELALARGRYFDAIRLLEQGADLRRLDDPGILGGVICKVGNAHRGLGDLSAAVARQREALQMTLDSHEIMMECQVRIELATTLTALGERAEALDHLHRSRTIAERHRLPQFIAQALSGLADLFDDEQPDTARSYRARAQAMLAHLDLPAAEPVLR